MHILPELLAMHDMTMFPFPTLHHLPSISFVSQPSSSPRPQLRLVKYLGTAQQSRDAVATDTETLVELLPVFLRAGSRKAAANGGKVIILLDAL